jgi:hypothetical protein
MRSRSPRHPLLLVLLVAVPALAACGDDAPAPEPGFVDVSLTSPNGAEGAAVFLVSDERVTRAETSSGVAYLRQATDGSRIVLVRDVGGDLAFRMEVEDVHRPPTVEVLEVAGPDDAVRVTLDGYRVEVGR